MQSVLDTSRLGSGLRRSAVVCGENGRWYAVINGGNDAIQTKAEGVYVNSVIGY